MSSVLATAQATDVVVLAGLFAGAALVAGGLASISSRVRNRLPVAVLARGNVLTSVALIAVGLALFTIGLG
jgi:hypothetical protein